MSENYEKAKYYYTMKFWSKKMLHKLAAKNFITAEEYKDITGEDYK